MEQRAPERDWSPFTGEQQRVEAGDYEGRESTADSSGPRATRRELRRGRRSLIALVAVLVALAAIAGVDNQWVVKNLIRYSNQHPISFPGHLVSALTVYQWRFTSQPGDRANEPLAHVVLVLTVLVLTGLLVYVISRGAITFWRAFLGTWIAVVVATLVGMVIRNLISPPPYPPNFSHLAGAVFLAPNGAGAVAGVVLGFVCALFASLVAVASRRRLSAGQPTTSRYSASDTRTYPTETYGGGYPYGDSDDYRNGDRYGQTASYRDAGENSYYGSGFASSAGSSSDTTSYATTPYAAAPMGAIAAGADSTGGEQATRQLPSSGGEQAPIAAPAAARQEPDAGADTAALPAQPEEAPGSGGDDAPTQAFPLPPDDEDLGHHPDAHDVPDRKG